MRSIKLFEEFVKGSHNYDEITAKDFLEMSESEIGWMVWNYPAHQPRAWGQWEEKQPDDFRRIWKGMLDADRDHGFRKTPFFSSSTIFCNWIFETVSVARGSTGYDLFLTWSKTRVFFGIL